MSKVHVNVTVSHDLVVEAREHRINLSSTFEEALQYKLSFIKQDIESLDRVKTQKELENEEKKLSKIQQKVTKLRDFLAKIDEKIAKNEQKQLQIEAEKVKKLQNCINCGTILTEKHKFHNFPAGKVCNSCFMGSEKENIVQWSQSTPKNGEK